MSNSDDNGEEEAKTLVRKEENADYRKESEELPFFTV